MTSEEICQYILARELLWERGVRCRRMEMVLFAMILKDWPFSEALGCLADFASVGAGAVERELDAAAQAAGHSIGARRLLEGLYEEVVTGED